MSPKITLRTQLFPGDLSAIVRYHDEYYARKYGFNHDFGRYVEGPLTEFCMHQGFGERIWLLDSDQGLKGCVALVRVTEVEAQLRWFYVDESIRCQGYGQDLMDRLIRFAMECEYQSIILWTVSQLQEARRVYERNGFELVEEHFSKLWGQNLVEQKYIKQLI